jgi:hypothetical protein
MKYVWISAFLLMARIASAESWVLWAPGPGMAFSKDLRRVELPLPPDAQGGDTLSVALRAVDVFGNVSATSDTLELQLPDPLPTGTARPVRAEAVRVAELTGVTDPHVPVPEAGRIRFLTQSRRIELEWRLPPDMETAGVQILRLQAPPPPVRDGGLALWRFPETHAGPDNIPARLHSAEARHPKLQSAELHIAEGYRLEGNVFRNSFGVRLAGERWGDVEDRADRYVSIRLTPGPGESIRLHEFMVGLWSVDSGGTLEHRLAYSLDGFRTRRELPLIPDRPVSETGRLLGAGVPARADLRSVARLQNLSEPVEFRLYLWGTNEKGLGKLGTGPSGENLPDLRIQGE